MRSFLVKKSPPLLSLKGKITFLGDKSIAHRAIIISALSPGKTIIENFPLSKDCLSTLSAFKKLGISIKSQPLKATQQSVKITVLGKGLKGLRKPDGPIFLGNSGTTLRLLLGVLAGADFKTRLTADKSLSHRPMRRVTRPLRMMGAQINSTLRLRSGLMVSEIEPSTLRLRSGLMVSEVEPSKFKIQNSKVIEEYPPITMSGGKLRSITYKMPVASAQVKSAILLAGLYTSGITGVIEQVRSRDHTERMLKLFKADIKVRANKIFISGNKELVSPGRIYIPGDISSAIFFIVLAILSPNAKILIKDVGLNPERTGAIKVLKRMGANIEIQNPKSRIQNPEPSGDLLVKSSRLSGTKVKKEEIPSLIDELPILMVAASCAGGRTIFAGIQELRVKETDRIRAMSENLKKMGVKIRILKTAESEQMVIQGQEQLKGNCQIKSFGDHRTAMSMVIAGLRAEGKTRIDDISCINKSFPGFLTTLGTVLKN